MRNLHGYGIEMLDCFVVIEACITISINGKMEQDESRQYVNKNVLYVTNIFVII